MKDAMSEIENVRIYPETVHIDHEEALKTHAVELYLLNELTERERFAFEEHYFECQTCAEAVEAGQIFSHNVEPTSPATGIQWRSPITAIAAFLAVIAGGQQFVIALSKAPQANTVVLARELEKGDANEETQSVETPSVTVECNLPTKADFPFYLLRIKGGEENKKISQVLPAPTNGLDRRLSLQIRKSTLGGGHFSVWLEGLRDLKAENGEAVEQYVFDLKGDGNGR
jgi:hypothetical protein